MGRLILERCPILHEIVCFKACPFLRLHLGGEGVERVEGVEGVEKIFTSNSQLLTP
jgi:hypothetical protein